MNIFEAQHTMKRTEQPAYIYFLSSGLFHRVILLSGTALSPWAISHNPDSIRKSIGEQTGCLSASNPEDKDISDCLRSR